MTAGEVHEEIEKTTGVGTVASVRVNGDGTREVIMSRGSESKASQAQSLADAFVEPVRTLTVIEALVLLASGDSDPDALEVVATAAGRIRNRLVS